MELISDTPKDFVIFALRRIFYANGYKNFENIDWDLKKQFEKACDSQEIDIIHEDDFDVLPDNTPSNIMEMAKTLDSQFMMAGFGHWFKNFELLS